jgi:hypothetical protein
VQQRISYTLKSVAHSGGVRSPSRNDESLDRWLILAQLLNGITLFCLFASLFLHTGNLVAYNLAPVRSILIWLNDSNVPLIAMNNNRLFPLVVGGLLTIGTLHTHVIKVNVALSLDAGFNNRNVLRTDKLIGWSDKSKWCQCRAIVLQ